jgi:hypothetical protein
MDDTTTAHPVVFLLDFDEKYIGLYIEMGFA